MDLSTKVLNNYPNFKGASKKIADYLLAHPKTFLQEDAQGLGKITKTSAASMIRFCQQLGFKGLKDFQIQLAQDTPQENENTIEPIVDNHRSEEHTSELQSRFDLVCRLLLEK